MGLVGDGVAVGAVAEAIGVGAGEDTVFSTGLGSVVLDSGCGLLFASGSVKVTVGLGLGSAVAGGVLGALPVKASETDSGINPAK